MTPKAISWEGVAAYLNAAIKESDGDPRLGTVTKIAAACGVTLRFEQRGSAR